MRRILGTARLALVVASIVAIAIPASTTAARTVVRNVTEVDRGPNFGYMDPHLNYVRFVESSDPAYAGLVEINLTLECPQGSGTSWIWNAIQEKTGAEQQAGTSETPACGEPSSSFIGVVEKPDERLIPSLGWIHVDIVAVACVTNAPPCDEVDISFDVNAR